MGRRYFCEYCNKSFIDELSVRKNHLKSIFHKRARENYYYHTRDPRTILKEEAYRAECRRLVNGERCPYGISCRYSHYSMEKLTKMEKIVHELDKVKRKKKKEVKRKDIESIPTYDSWLLTRNKSTDENGESLRSNFIDKLWEYDFCHDTDDLPESLRKLTADSFTNGDFKQWGE